MMEVTVIGGIHSKALDENQICDLIAKKRIEAIFTENVDSSIFKKDLKYIITKGIYDPIFLIFSFFYFYLFEIKLLGKDFRSINKIAEKTRVPVYRNIDANLEDLLKYFPIKIIFFPILFALIFALISLIIQDFSLAYLIVELLLCILLYGLFVAVITANYRNQKMVKNAVSIMKSRNIKRALFYSGSCHTKEIIKLFKQEGLVTNELLQK
jgi:hypothetical protein